MKILFIITTISQLLNASQIAIDFRKKGRYISACLAGQKVKRYENQIKRSFIFDDVFCNNWADCGVNIGNKRLNRVRDLFDYWSIKNSCSNFENNYDEIFISGPNLRNLEIYYYLTRNKKIDLFFYEEGIFEYYFLADKFDKKEVLASYIFFGRYYKKEIKGVFVHNPKMSLTNNINYIQIPSIESETDNKLWQDYLETLFPQIKDLKINIDNKIIFIDQPYEIDEENGIKDTKLREIFSVIFLQQRKNIVVKLHPRSIENKYGTEVEYLPQNIPFEIIFSKLHPRNVTLVSVCSSTVFNIMLRHGKDVKAVMLYKLIDDKFNSYLKIKKLINQYNTIISNDLSQKIYVIDSLLELKNICEE